MMVKILKPLAHIHLLLAHKVQQYMILYIARRDILCEKRHCMHFITQSCTQYALLPRVVLQLTIITFLDVQKRKKENHIRSDINKTR